MVFYHNLREKMTWEFLHRLICVNNPRGNFIYNDKDTDKHTDKYTDKHTDKQTDTQMRSKFLYI